MIRVVKIDEDIVRRKKKELSLFNAMKDTQPYLRPEDLHGCIKQATGDLPYVEAEIVYDANPYKNYKHPELIKPSPITTLGIEEPSGAIIDAEGRTVIGSIYNNRKE